MVLTDKEKVIAIIANGIAVFSLLQERGEITQDSTLYDFVLKAMPEGAEFDVELIDEVFQYVSNVHRTSLL